MDFAAIQPLYALIAEAKSLNDLTIQHRDWRSDADRERWHSLVQEVYSQLAPLLKSLAEAGILSATFHCDGAHFVWFEVDEISAGGTIDFSGAVVLEATDPPASALLFDGGSPA